MNMFTAIVLGAEHVSCRLELSQNTYVSRLNAFLYKNGNAALLRLSEYNLGCYSGR